MGETLSGGFRLICKLSSFGSPDSSGLLGCLGGGALVLKWNAFDNILFCTALVPTARTLTE
eukprot:3401553-Prymnesium_polylepis.1